MPLSGAAGGDYSGDVKALGLCWQVKSRANGWRTLYAALEGHDALAVKADRKVWLVVVPLDTFTELLGA